MEKEEETIEIPKVLKQMDTPLGETARFIWMNVKGPARYEQLRHLLGESYDQTMELIENNHGLGSEEIVLLQLSQSICGKEIHDAITKLEQRLKILESGSGQVNPPENLIPRIEELLTSVNDRLIRLENNLTKQEPAKQPKASSSSDFFRQFLGRWVLDEEKNKTNTYIIRRYHMTENEHGMRIDSFNSTLMPCGSLVVTTQPLVSVSTNGTHEFRFGNQDEQKRFELSDGYLIVSDGYSKFVYRKQ